MATPGDMTIGELARRMDALLTEMRETRAEMQAHNRRFEQEFMRRSEYDALQAVDALQMRGLEEEVHSLVKRLDAAEERRRVDRALIISAFVAPVVVAVIVAFLLRGIA